MLQLIYVSRATASVRQEDVRAILETAVAFNGGHDVTGLLVFDGRWFMQALEGPHDIVTALFERIKKDWRNENVGLVSRRMITTRAFGDWAMAWNPMEPTGAGERLEDIVAALVAGVQDPDLRGAFERFSGIVDLAYRLTRLSQTQH